MSDVRIERLRLRVAGLDEGAARRLAELVAERLAASESPAAGSATIAALRVQVKNDGQDHVGQDHAGQDHAALANRIVEAIGRELAL